jgi:hypothetical protein
MDSHSAMAGAVVPDRETHNRNKDLKGGEENSTAHS